jgi:lysyl endopeptidase
MPEFDMTMKAKSARESSIRLKSLEFAHPFSVQMNPYNSGEWRMLADGRKVWKLGIQSKDAYSLNLIFDKFMLNEGASLFIYTPDKAKILGAYDYRNNHESGLAIEPLPGEAIILELIVPSEISNWGELNIAWVNHDFLGIFGTKDSKNGNSGECNVDINCPEGNERQLEKNAIMRLLINGNYYCTGALINNTSQDGKPYVLTANHCVSLQTEATNTVFLFGYEASSCNGTGSSSKSLSGSQLRATKGSLDMTLLEINNSPPLDYRPHYLGWNRQTSPATTTTGIHHPSGDVKKICIATDNPVSVTVQGYSSQAHWWIKKWVIGTTEPGSSGSPLIDVNSRIIGYLSGGDAECGYPFDDYYGKFSSAWDLFPTANEQLKAWLDPGNTGQTTLNGFNPYQNQTLAADFEVNTANICTGEVFVFTDFSRGNITSYSWNFGAGASPATASGKGPHLVSYSSQGTKSVSLQVGDGTNTNELQKNLNLSIKSTGLPLADFTEVINLRQVSFTNLSVNAITNYWEFGDGTSSTVLNPVKTYASNGDYPVMLWVRNGPCNDKLTRTILKVSTPVVKENNKVFKLYPNPSAGIFNIEYFSANPNGTVEVFTVAGKKVYSTLINSHLQILELSHLPAGVYFLKVHTAENTYVNKLLISR